MAVATGLTIDDFEKLPADLARKHELVHGELVDVSGNTGNHNSLRDLLIELLAPYVRQRKLGKVIGEQEFNFDGNAHGPDVSFLNVKNARRFDGNRRVQPFVPELAIEIVSQNDTFEALMKKALRYRRCGTKEVWIFDIENRNAFALSERQQAILDESRMFQSDLIPGFSIRIGELLDRI